MNTYSAIVTTHRRPEWLKRALLSIKAQRDKSVDVIVVSDVACDQTSGVVNSMLGSADLFIQRGGPPGPAESRNVGIRALATDYAFFLDDDDEIAPDFVHRMDALRPADFRGILYSDAVFHVHRQGTDGREQIVVQPHAIAANAVSDTYVRNFIPNSCLMYPVDILRSCRFDTSLTLNEGWDFILNAMSRTSLTHVPVGGPIIHKTEAPRRDNSNSHKLLETYISIYSRWPAPTTDLKLARQSLLAQTGVHVPLTSL